MKGEAPCIELFDTSISLSLSLSLSLYLKVVSVSHTVFALGVFRVRRRPLLALPPSPRRFPTMRDEKGAASTHYLANDSLAGKII